MKRAITTILLVIVACITFWYGARYLFTVHFYTPYQAVLLSNGTAYFGKLHGYGTSYPVLTDVWYLAPQPDPHAQAQLIKRGHEIHGPDRMYLNPNAIVAVEPVTIGSQVDKVINAQDQTKK